MLLNPLPSEDGVIVVYSPDKPFPGYVAYALVSEARMAGVVTDVL